MIDGVEDWERQGRALLIFRDGAKCAAWLVNRHRRRLRRTRRASFCIPSGEVLPAWFDIAFCFLRDHRQGKWKATKTAMPARTYYVIEWVGRGLGAIGRA